MCKITPKLTENFENNLKIAIRNGGGLASPGDRLWGQVSNRGEAWPRGMARSSSCGSSRALHVPLHVLSRITPLLLFRSPRACLHFLLP